MMTEFAELRAETFASVRDAMHDGNFVWLDNETAKETFPGAVGCVWKVVGAGETGLPGCVETTAEYATLFAASPRLLRALKLLDAYFDFGEAIESGDYGIVNPAGVNAAFAEARAAIAKAEGR